MFRNKIFVGLIPSIYVGFLLAETWLLARLLQQSSKKNIK